MNQIHKNMKQYQKLVVLYKIKELAACITRKHNIITYKYHTLQKQQHK